MPQKTTFWTYGESLSSKLLPLTIGQRFLLKVCPCPVCKGRKQKTKVCRRTTPFYSPRLPHFTLQRLSCLICKSLLQKIILVLTYVMVAWDSWKFLYKRI